MNVRSGLFTPCSVYLMFTPLSIGRKFNVHETFRRCLGRFRNVLCTLYLRVVKLQTETEESLFFSENFMKSSEQQFLRKPHDSCMWFCFDNVFVDARNKFVLTITLINQDECMKGEIFLDYFLSRWHIVKVNITEERVSPELFLLAVRSW